MDDLNPQALANTAWAFAALGHGDVALFAALAGKAKQRLGEFSPQDHAITNVQAVLAKSCGMNSPTRCLASFASAANSAATARPTVAKTRRIYLLLKTISARIPSRVANRNSTSRTPKLRGQLTPKQ